MVDTVNSLLVRLHCATAAKKVLHISYSADACFFKLSLTSCFSPTPLLSLTKDPAPVMSLRAADELRSYWIPAASSYGNAQMPTNSKNLGTND